MGHTNTPGSKQRGVTLRLSFRNINPIRLVKAVFACVWRLPMLILGARLRYRFVLAAVILVVADMFGLINPFFKENAYALGESGALLSAPNQMVADRIKFDETKQTYSIDAKAVAQSADNPSFGDSNLAGVTLHKDPSKGVTVSDPNNNIDFSMTPQFDLSSGRKDHDRIVYPLKSRDGFAVYTLKSTGVKEDIILTKSKDDTRSFAYTLNLGSNLEAKLEADGSLGVYGNNLLSGNVTAGSDKDKQLLDKARKSAPKNTLVFTIPAPVVTNAQGVDHDITAKFGLKDNTLTVTASGLKNLDHPISIDPTIYVTSAQQLMAGNGESNIDFDVDNKLVTQSQLSGGRIGSWGSTTTLPTAVWGSETAISGGYIYSVGGTSSSGQVSTVNWAKLDANTHTITSTNPGDGACGGWCNESTYNLPDGREKFSLVTYNGYLYVIGGYSTNCTAGNGTGENGFCDTVYIAKLGANGEPRLWHPSDTNSDNWVYWYRNPTDLPTARILTEALAYGNTMYLVGGLESSGTVTNTLGKISINPNGTLATWSLAANLPSARYDHDAVIYNDRLYLIGGATTAGGAPVNSVYFTKLQSNGSVGSWQQTTNMPDGIRGIAGDFTTALDGYLYITGGCKAVNGSGYCTTASSSTQFASINADGSIGNWNSTSASLATTRVGHTLTKWHGALYVLGGCTQQNSSNGSCEGMANTSYYGVVKKAGELSLTYQSTASGSATCTGGNATNCDLPGSSYVGNLLSTTVISNGYLYIIGGCTNNSCSSTSGNTAYMKLTSSGTLQRPATCPNGSYEGTGWCVDTAHTISGGVAASSPVVFNDTIYLVGGLNGSNNTGSILRATSNSDGSIGNWTTQTLSSVNATNVSYTYAYGRANPTEASSNPGNLYIFGGCTTSNGATCSSYTGAVYKCTITSSGSVDNCTTSDQLQLGTLNGASGAGLALHSGAVYGEYIYLIGGSAPGLSDIDTVRYARFNSNNNIVSTTSSDWTTSATSLSNGRHRASAFINNGYLYVAGGYDAGTASIASAAEYIGIDSSDGSLIGNWQQAGTGLSARWGVSVAYANSYGYLVGGCTTGAAPSSCTARSDTLQTFTLHNNSGGAPDNFTTSANTYATDANRFGAGVAMYDGRIYVVGGCSGTASCTSTTNSVTYASISDTGVIGTWSNATANLPAARGFGKLLVGGSSLYFVGGQNNAGTAQSTVYYTTPGTNGNIASWSTATSGLPNARADFGATTWNNRIYIVGGKGTSGDCTSGRCDTVYVSPSLSLGGDITGNWSTASGDFNIPRSGVMATANGNALYISGGYDGSSYLSDVQYAKIDTSTGDIGNWSRSSSMPRPIAQGDSFSANGYLYIIGGRSADNICRPVTFVAPINNTSPEGALSGIGEWYQASASYTGDRFGNAAIYHDGKAYVVGGADCKSTSTSYSSATTNATYTVPSGVTDITVKAWGAGGGSGGGDTFSGSGGAGGGGGYSTSVLTVTPGENLTVRVGGGGGGGNAAGTGGGGGGGGYSGILRSSTPLLLAGGGGGGGGSRASTTHGGAGGAGGCTTTLTSCNGSTSVSNSGGGGGSSSAGGAAGSGNCGGGAGGSLTSGAGANKNYFTCGTGGGATGGTNGGADGGIGRNGIPGDNAGGGGGGGGRYGGGGGAGGGNESSGGGGGAGGGSSYVTGSSTTTTAGSGMNPGNSSDSDRGTAGQASAGATGGTGSTGNPGKVIVYDGILTYPSPAIAQTSLLSQPQIGKYSILFDLEADVFPNHWLVNGSDSTDGTRWEISYKSMTNPDANVQCGSGAMTTWGSTTTFADANLATPSILTAKDGSGIDTNCTRYFSFSLTMDSTRSSSFPNLPTGNPAINEIVLSMVANPAKRLRHGRSFIGGLQSPIDTPYYGY